jgi:hypothetical protein
MPATVSAEVGDRSWIPAGPTTENCSGVMGKPVSSYCGNSPADAPGILSTRPVTEAIKVR